MVRLMPIGASCCLMTASEASQSVYPVMVMMVRFNGFDGEYPAEASNCLALSGFGLSYPEAVSAALSMYLEKVGRTMPVWLAAGCWPPSPMVAICLRSIACAIAWRTASLLVAACDGSRLQKISTLVTGGDHVWLLFDLPR